MASPKALNQLRCNYLLCAPSWLVSVFAGCLARHREGGGPLRVDGPDLVKQAALQTRVSGGNLRRFLEAARHDEPVAAYDLFGFAKRAVRHACPGNRLSCGRESLAGLHLSFINKSA